MMQPSETTTATFLLSGWSRSCVSRMHELSTADLEPAHRLALPFLHGFPASKLALTIEATLWGCFMDRSFPFVSPVEEVKSKTLVAKSLCTFLTVA